MIILHPDAERGAIKVDVKNIGEPEFHHVLSEDKRTVTVYNTHKLVFSWSNWNV